jgi:hypothetical protein
MWVSKDGPPDKPVVLFDYDPSRGQEVAARLLDGFEGYVQCDGLASYDAACGKNSQRKCWAASIMPDANTLKLKKRLALPQKNQLKFS